MDSRIIVGFIVVFLGLTIMSMAISDIYYRLRALEISQAVLPETIK